MRWSRDLLGGPWPGVYIVAVIIQQAAWRGGAVVGGRGLTIKWRSRVRSPAGARLRATTLGKLFTPICLDADALRYHNGVDKPGTSTSHNSTGARVVSRRECQLILSTHTHTHTQYSVRYAVCDAGKPCYSVTHAEKKETTFSCE